MGYKITTKSGKVITIPDKRSEKEKSQVEPEKVQGIMNPFATGIAQMMREFSGANQPLEEAAAREREIMSQVPAETIRRLSREGKPLPQATLSQQQEGLTTSNLSNRQVLGSAANTALLATMGGTLNPALASGKMATKISGLRSILGPAGQTAVAAPTRSLAKNVGIGTAEGALGAGAGAAAQGASGEDIAKSAALGAPLGAAFPAAASGIGALARKELPIAGRSAAHVFGSTTGAGANKLKRAFKRPQTVEKLRKAQLGGEEIEYTAGNTIKDTLSNFDESLKKFYGKHLDNILKANEGVEVNYKPVVDNVQEAVNDSLSTITKTSEKNAIKRATRELLHFRKSGKTDLENYNDMRKRVSNILDGVASPDNKPSNSYDRVAAMIKKETGKVLPEELQQLNARYANIMNEIIEPLKANVTPTTKNRNAAETFVHTLFNPNNKQGSRRIIEQLDEKTAGELLEHLEDVVTAKSLTEPFPPGLMRSSMASLTTGGLGTAGLVTGNIPLMATGLGAFLSTSPRFVGKSATAMGRHYPKATAAGRGLLDVLQKGSVPAGVGVGRITPPER